MGSRARLIISVVVAIVAVGAMWILLVAPKRSEASKLLAEVASEQADRAAAEQQLASAEQARNGYATNVIWLKRLERSVPRSDQEPQLIDLVNALEEGHDVNYTITDLGPGSPTTAGFPTLTFTFTFEASYIDLQRFLGALDDLTLANGVNVRAGGRLAAISSISLVPHGVNDTQATVIVTVYQSTAPAATVPTGATGASGATGGTGMTGASTAAAP